MEIKLSRLLVCETVFRLDTFNNYIFDIFFLLVTIIIRLPLYKAILGTKKCFSNEFK